MPPTLTPTSPAPAGLTFTDSRSAPRARLERLCFWTCTAIAVGSAMLAALA